MEKNLRFQLLGGKQPLGEAQFNRARQQRLLDVLVKTLLKCPHSHSGENVPIWFNQLFFQAVAAVGEPERSEGLPEAATA
jgi:hypothetical protein